MVRESNQNVFLIQIDASSFAEFEISEFEISRRVDCIRVLILCMSNKLLQYENPVAKIRFCLFIVARTLKAIDFYN